MLAVFCKHLASKSGFSNSFVFNIDVIAFKQFYENCLMTESLLPPPVKSLQFEPMQHLTKILEDVWKKKWGKLKYNLHWKNILMWKEWNSFHEESLHNRFWPVLFLSADETISANKMANTLPNTDLLSRKSDIVFHLVCHINLILWINIRKPPDTLIKLYQCNVVQITMQYCSDVQLRVFCFLSYCRHKKCNNE